MWRYIFSASFLLPLVTAGCEYRDDFTQTTCQNVLLSDINHVTGNKLTLRNVSGVLTSAIFDDMPDWIYVTIENSWIDDVTDHVFVNLTKLQFLVFLNNGKFPDFSETFLDVGNLKWLAVLGNKNRIHDGALKFLTQLLWLYIQEQEMPTLHRDFLATNGQLHELTINRCGLQEIEVGALYHTPDLEILSLNFNKLKSLPDNTFQNLNNLKILELHHNHFTNFDLGQFRHLTSLEIVGFPSVLVRNVQQVTMVTELFPKLKMFEMKKRDLRSNQTKNLAGELRRRKIRIIGTPHDCHLPPFFTCDRHHKVIK